MIRWEFKQELVDPETTPIDAYLAHHGYEGWQLVQMNPLPDEDMVGIIMQRPFWEGGLDLAYFSDN